MGSGANSKQRKVNAAPQEANGYSGKTVSSPFSEFCTLEDEVKWLRFKLAEEKKEKDLMMTRNNHQIPPTCSSSSSCEDAAGKRNEQEIIWLRRMFDAEKTEKAWVMARIEGLEAQLKTRSEECSSLCAALHGGRQAARATLPPDQPGIPKSPARNKAWIQDPVPPKCNVVMEPTSPSKDLGPVSPGGGLSLKERRGLKLAVSTGKAPLAVSTSGVVSGTTPLVADSAVPLLNPQEALQVSSELPKRSSTHTNNHPLMEPMSPLLARRTGTRAGLGESRRDSGCSSQSSTVSLARPPLVLGESFNDGAIAKNQPLKVNAEKMAACEAPASPKRRHRPEWAESKGSKEKPKAPEEASTDRAPSLRRASLEQVPEDQVPDDQLAKAEDMYRQTTPEAPAVEDGRATMSMPCQNFFK